MKQEFYDELAKAVNATFKGAIDEVGAENLTGFGLYTDESIMSIAVSINTAEFFENNVRNDPSNKEGYRWSIGEWKEENQNGAMFDSFSDVMLKESQESERELSIRKKEFVAKCIEILEGVKNFVPDRINKEFVLLFGISDFFDPDTEGEWIRRLNSPDKLQIYKDWVSSFE